MINISGIYDNIRSVSNDTLLRIKSSAASRIMISALRDDLSIKLKSSKVPRVIVTLGYFFLNSAEADRRSAVICKLG
jgi:hypothetical protein